jgi:hypothetical protein
VSGKLFVVVAVAGCSFHVAHEASDGRGSGSADAPIADAHVDAKVFLDAPAVAGSLVVTPSVVADGTIDLTAEGTLDWAHWGFSSAASFEHKLTGSAIGNATVVGTGVQLQITAVSLAATWADGTPDMTSTTASGTATATGTGVHAPGGLSFVVPAGVAPRTLRVYVGVKAANGRFDAVLSGIVATSYTNTQSAASNAVVHLVYDIVYNAASDGQTLTITWTDTGDASSGSSSFAMLLSATLQ